MAEPTDLDPDDNLGQLRDRLDDLTPLYTQIGAFLVAQTQRSFRTQVRAVAWPPRMVPNVPGIVEDLNRGRIPPRRRFQPRPALGDTGRLRGSITFRASATNVVIGTNVQYASVHQFGGTTRHRLSATGRQGLTRWLRSRAGQPWRRDLGWLFSQPAFTVRVRPRPFLAVTSEDRAEIVDLVRDFLGT